MTSMRTHTDKAYAAELLNLRESLLRMAGCVEQMIAKASDALIRGDASLAQATIDADNQVDALEMEIDERCLLILAKRQPLASDLRMITVAMKMVTDLERIGDLAVNVAERSLAIGVAPQPNMADTMRRMSEAAQKMIHDSIESFNARDVDRARTVFAADEVVDALYREFTDALLKQMVAEPSYIERGIHLHAVAKFLERIGDHATNLAELVIFLVERVDIRHTTSESPAAEINAAPQQQKN